MNLLSYIPKDQLGQFMKDGGKDIKEGAIKSPPLSSDSPLPDEDALLGSPRGGSSLGSPRSTNSSKLPTAPTPASPVTSPKNSPREQPATGTGTKLAASVTRKATSAKPASGTPVKKPAPRSSVKPTGE